MTDLTTRLRALDEKMTPGPWDRFYPSINTNHMTGAGGTGEGCAVYAAHEEVQALATLRNLWPLVVDALEVAEVHAESGTYHPREHPTLTLTKRKFQEALAALQEALDAE